MLAIAAESPAKDTFKLVEDLGTESEYLQTARGVVLPRATRIGGIAGKANPYPPMKLRTYKGVKMGLVAEQDIDVQKSTMDTGAEPTEDDHLLTSVNEDHRQPREAEVVHNHRAQGPTNESAHFRDAVRQEMRQYMHQTSALCGHGSTEERNIGPETEITFKGSFGFITVPYRRVISTPLALVLVQDRKSPYRYHPPESEETVFSVSWKDGRETRHVDVRNYGLSFDYDEETRLLVLLPDA